ncbi:MAG: hypothetical protein ACNA8W_11585 [Bradymonadaceae bacterium]
MSESPLFPDAARWREAIATFKEQQAQTCDTEEELSPLQNWQRRITGGLIVQFFEFLEKSDLEELYPALKELPLHRRVFLLVTDEPGMIAARELMDMDSPQAIALLKEEWRALLESDDFDEDETYVHHYQCWSVWHQIIPTGWELPTDVGGEFWVHEEGFALAGEAGRGAQHLWVWDGREMTLSKETMTSWVS